LITQQSNLTVRPTSQAEENNRL